MQKIKRDKLWRFIDQNGTFQWNDPEFIHELYFPLCNESGIMSSVTPMLHGDLKTDQHHFLMLPVSIEDFHNTKSGRNFWLHIDGIGAWSATGNSASQNSKKYTVADKSERLVEAGLLWHKLTYTDNELGLISEVTSFVPCEAPAEIMVVSIKNISNQTYTITPTSVIPLYGRSAENVRDHRHVTSLVNRIENHKNGMILKPVIVFDEKGHKMNETMYYVIGFEGNGKDPIGTFPSTGVFIGSKGSFDWPESVVKNLPPQNVIGENNDGKDCAGAIRFEETIIKPGESKDYIVLFGISHEKSQIEVVQNKYNSLNNILSSLEKNKEYWKEKAEKINFESGLHGFDNWMKWVSVQPTLRKIYGCSFLPYHDYGKGGRGWRDLWQDCLSLILQNPSDVRELLINNFAGIRADGTNATIIGNQMGEFIADRNNISRVWMDHGAWPYLTTKLYLDSSGDLEILLEKQSYFRDAQIKRAAQKDENWVSEDGNKLKTIDQTLYDGAVLEHLLVQHLTSFFNVGEHNIIRLEGADWNDTLDMARQRGESTAFTALYGSNLIDLSNLLFSLKEKLKLSTIEVFEELHILMDTLYGNPNYQSIEYKKTILNQYLEAVSNKLSGKKIGIDIDNLSNDLKIKGEWIFENIRKNEWIETSEGTSFFNGYYNNDGGRVDGQFDDTIRMNLTGQVFTTMFGLATDEQVLKSYQSCKKYLKDPATGGYRLNTHLGPNQLNFGRGFSFAYGEKENGATFCHMVIMYINALYKRGFVNEAYEVFSSIFNLCMNNDRCGIYPGIPEYFSAGGKGMYHYLTGSASWLLLTVLNEMYGIKGDLGNLTIEPKLVPEQFDQDGNASVSTSFYGKKVKIVYINPDKIDYSEYKIVDVVMNGKSFIQYKKNDKKVVIPKEDFSEITGKENNNIQVYLIRDQGSPEKLIDVPIMIT